MDFELLQPQGKKRERNHHAAWMVARKRVEIRRPYPLFVDMGTLTSDNNVRFDSTRNVYDLRDAVMAGYGNERAVNVTAAHMGTSFGLDESKLERVKWSDCEHNTGKGRLVADAASCATVLRNSIEFHKRCSTRPMQAALWFEDQALANTPPDTFHATVSFHGLQNQRE